MLSQYKCGTDTYLEKKEKKMPAMCLNPDALQMLLLLLFSTDGLASRYGRKLKHLVYIIVTCL